MVRMATSAATLPLYTLDLARRYWAPLLCVYTMGAFLHQMVIRGTAMLGVEDPNLGLLSLSFALMVTLVTTILMFHMLRPGLPVLDHELHVRTVRARGGDPNAALRTSIGEHERRVVEAVAMAILPFMIFYSAWGLIAEEFRLYGTQVLNQSGIAAYRFISELDALGVPLAIALGAWLLRFACEKFYDRNQNKWLGIATAVFEAVWIFFAVFTIGRLIGDIKSWLAERAFVAEVKFAAADLFNWLEGLTALPIPAVAATIAAFLVTMWTLLKDGLLEPLLWLTIAAVVFGAEVDKAETLFRKDSRVERIRQAASRVPSFVTRIGEFASRDLRDKYTPFLNAFRFILSVSPVFYLSFCLYYGLLELGFGWLERGVYVLVGPHDFLGWWWPWLFPIEYVVEALHELLRVCLLAATFEVTLRRLGGQSIGRRARRADRFPG